MMGTAPGAEVPYAEDAFRFWGATFDPSGLYRFNAAMDWLAGTDVSIADVHHHSVALQKHFLDDSARLGVEPLAARHLVPPPGAPRGNFLAFDVDNAEELHRRIAAENITIDRRGRRLRFGFGVYHDVAEVERLLQAVARALGRKG